MRQNAVDSELFRDLIDLGNVFDFERDRDRDRLVRIIRRIEQRVRRGRCECASIDAE